MEKKSNVIFDRVRSFTKIDYRRIPTWAHWFDPLTCVSTYLDSSTSSSKQMVGNFHDTDATYHMMPTVLVSNIKDSVHHPTESLYHSYTIYYHIVVALSKASCYYSPQKRELLTEGLFLMSHCFSTKKRLHRGTYLSTVKAGKGHVSKSTFVIIAKAEKRLLEEKPPILPTWWLWWRLTKAWKAVQCSEGMKAVAKGRVNWLLSSLAWRMRNVSTWKDFLIIVQAYKVSEIISKT